MFFLLFIMSITSIISSLYMDQKLYQHQANNHQLEELKAQFSHTRKQLMSSKRNIIKSAQKFGFESDKKNIVFIKND